MSSGQNRPTSETYCETIAAYQWHIREVGPEGVLCHGNPRRSRTLCGLPSSWDINVPVSDKINESTRNDWGTGICSKCVSIYNGIRRRRDGSTKM